MKYQDIHLADKSLWQQYQQYMQAGQTAQALALLENAQLADKGMTADVFNGLTTEMVRLENQGKDSTWSKSVIPMAKRAPAGMQSGDMYFKQLGGAINPLCVFTDEYGVTFSLNLINAAYPLTKNQLFETSYDMVTWEPYTLGASITLTPQGNSRIYFRGNNTTVNESSRCGVRFVDDGSGMFVSGNIMSLLNYSDVVPAHCFEGLFMGTVLLSYPELPAVVVGDYGYSAMFADCNGLDTITEPVELPATTLGVYAYGSMFEGSTLVTAPVLPAKTIGEHSYGGMFSQCLQLKSAPNIAATNFGYAACEAMFAGDVELQSIKMAYTGNFVTDNQAFSNWVSGVSLSGTFYYNGSDTTRGASAIPTGWTIQKF